LVLIPGTEEALQRRLFSFGYIDPAANHPFFIRSLTAISISDMAVLFLRELNRTSTRLTVAEANRGLKSNCVHLARMRARVSQESKFGTKQTRVTYEEIMKNKDNRKDMGGPLPS